VRRRPAPAAAVVHGGAAERRLTSPLVSGCTCQDPIVKRFLPGGPRSNERALAASADGRINGTDARSGGVIVGRMLRRDSHRPPSASWRHWPTVRSPATAESRGPILWPPPGEPAGSSPRSQLRGHRSRGRDRARHNGTNRTERRRSSIARAMSARGRGSLSGAGVPGRMLVRRAAWRGDGTIPY
jgi:hypothetical protein